MITLTNRGPMPLSIRSAEITGPHGGDFAICAEDFSGVDLYTGSSCSLSVRFRPSAAGWRTADLLLYGTGRKSPWRVALSGYGASLELLGDGPDLAVKRHDLLAISVAAVGRCQRPHVLYGKAELVPGSECEQTYRQELQVAVPISVHVQARCDGRSEPVKAVFHTVALQPVQVTVPLHFEASSCDSGEPEPRHPQVQTCRFHVVQRLQVEVPAIFSSDIACRLMTDCK